MKIPSPTSVTVQMALGGYARHVPEHLNIVEIGVYQGATLHRMALEAKAHVYGIDPWEDGHYDARTKHRKYVTQGRSNRDNAAKFLAMQGLRDKVTLVQGFATEVGLTWTDGPVGLWFHDGAHDFNTVIEDIMAWKIHWDANATIVFDDYWVNHPGVVSAVQFACEATWLKLEVVLAGRLAVCSIP